MKTWLKSLIFGLVIAIAACCYCLLSGDTVDFLGILGIAFVVIFFALLSYPLFSFMTKNKEELAREKKNRAERKKYRYNTPFSIKICIFLCGWIVCSFFPLGFIFLIANIAVLLLINKQKKTIVVLPSYTIKTGSYFIAQIFYLVSLVLLVLAMINSGYEVGEFYADSELSIFAFLCAGLSLWSYIIFVKIFSIYRNVRFVRNTLDANKYTNLSKYFGLKGYKANKFLVLHEDSFLSAANTITEYTDDKYLQTALSVIYPKMCNYDGIIWKKWNQLNYINVSKILIDCEKKLSPEEKKLIVQRVSEDYSSIPLDEIEMGLASVSGVIAGIIDSFFVGRPDKKNLEESKLGQWVDEKFADLVLNIADIEFRRMNPDVFEKLPDTGVTREYREYKKMDLYNKKLYVSPFKDKNIPKEIRVKKAKRFLEARSKINYDATNAKQLNKTKDEIALSTQNHHMRNLDHGLDVIALILSIVDQFHDKGSFVDNNQKLIRLDTNSEGNLSLYGSTFSSKLWCAITNWFFHCMSDISGSSGSKGRGAGLPAPLYEFLQFVKVGDMLNIGKIAEELYLSGYDARFMATASIPVFINECFIRFSYILKQHYYHDVPWADLHLIKDNLPSDTTLLRVSVGESQKLNKMLVIGYGTFCAIDLSDATIRAEGFNFETLLYMNIPGWKNLATEGLITCKSVFRKLTTNPEKIEHEILRLSDKYLKEQDYEIENDTEITEIGEKRKKKIIIASVAAGVLGVCVVSSSIFLAKPLITKKPDSSPVIREKKTNKVEPQIVERFSVQAGNSTTIFKDGLSIAFNGLKEYKTDIGFNFSKDNSTLYMLVSIPNTKKDIKEMRHKAYYYAAKLAKMAELGIYNGTLKYSIKDTTPYNVYTIDDSSFLELCRKEIPNIIKQTNDKFDNTYPANFSLYDEFIVSNDTVYLSNKYPFYADGSYIEKYDSYSDRFLLLKNKWRLDELNQILERSVGKNIKKAIKEIDVEWEKEHVIYDNGKEKDIYTLYGLYEIPAKEFVNQYLNKVFNTHVDVMNSDNLFGKYESDNKLIREYYDSMK